MFTSVAETTLSLVTVIEYVSVEPFNTGTGAAVFSSSNVTG